jgi:hypothetical protein
MKRRSKAGGEPIKGRRREAQEPKDRDAPKAVARSNSTSPAMEVNVEIGHPRGGPACWIENTSVKFTPVQADARAERSPAGLSCGHAVVSVVGGIYERNTGRVQLLT